MKLNHKGLMTLAMVLLGAPSFAADDNPPAGLSIGDRVRLKLENGVVVVGKVTAFDETLEVAIDGKPNNRRSVSLDAITTLDRSIGRKGRTADGAAIGASVGLLLPMLIIVAPGCSPCDVAPIEVAAVVAAVTVPVGTGIGAIVGAGIRGDKWERMAVPTTDRRRTSFSVAPSRRGVSARFAISWR